MEIVRRIIPFKKGSETIQFLGMCWYRALAFYMSPSSHLHMHTSQQNNLPSTRPNLKCYSLNYAGSCFVKYNGNYHHTCLYCSGDHPLIRCSSNPTQNNINQKSFPSFPNTSQRPLLNWKVGAKSDSCLPITRDILVSLITVLPSACTSQYETKLFKAAFSVAFHGLLRIGELAINNGGVQGMYYWFRILLFLMTILS
jgi:hypothetical protein